jgi:prepilin-type N-terminal cleavage/methylation domain-containing protein
MNRRGFTLLEATVSLALVGVVAIGALETFAVEARTATTARRAAPAAAIAAERMARLSVADAALLRALPDSLARGAAVDGALSYAWTARSAPVPNETGLYTLRVNVAWDGGQTALVQRVYRPVEERAK